MSEWVVMRREAIATFGDPEVQRMELAVAGAIVAVFGGKRGAGASSTTVRFVSESPFAAQRRERGGS